MRHLVLTAALASALTAVAADATTVAWTDWTESTATTAIGSIVSGPTTLGITLSTSGEALYFVQTGTGTNYFTEGTPAPYTGGSVSNAPPAAEMVALGAGGTKTITFSQAVTNPYIAFVSWNGNAASFSKPFAKISEGCGYWGCGTFSLGAGNSFVGDGEVHGVLDFVGTFTSLSFTDTTEYWHGLTVGIGGVAPIGATVPEPASWTLMISGFGLIGSALRRRRPAIA
jgi:hypothetical protein